MHILWIKTELLHPVDKGGRIRTYQMLRALARQHEVTYLAMDDGTAAPDAIAKASEYCARVEVVPFTPAAKGSLAFYGALLGNLVSPLPYAIAKYEVPAVRERLVRLCRERKVDVVVCDFLAPSINVPDDLGVPVVLFQHNVEAMIWERHAQVATHPVKKAYMTEQWKRMKRFEASECRRVSSVVAVSTQDAEVFRRDYGVREVPDVPTGVDTDYFVRQPDVARTAGSMVFTGSMDWMPNEDGIAWFVDAILPRIRAAVPHATLTIVGRNPTAKVKSLHTPAAGVTVTGSVPDVRPYLASHQLFIVPLRVGGGTRLKIYEGMTMGLPTVSTTIGAEGLPVVDGEHLVLADDPESFARQCIALLQDPARASAMGDAADTFVRQHFGWDGVARRFAEFCQAAIPAAPASLQYTKA
ncbi:MAG TPA: glycosyltransferase [Gemmatimonadaceae bacterium]|nr:glycosyltransferase [Gemmatimonadaceae bacterium]